MDKKLNYEEGIEELKALIDTRLQNAKFESSFAEITVRAGLMFDMLIKPKHNYTLAESRNIICMTVFLILICWLQNDKSACQTIVSFVKEPYTPINEQKYGELGKIGLYVDDAKVSAMKRGEKIYRDNIDLQNQQAMKEKQGFKRNKYKNRNSKIRYNFIELSFMNYFVESNMSIYRRLFFLKNIMGSKTTGLKELAKDYEGINNITKSLSGRMQNLNPRNENTKIEDIRGFVADCFQFFLLETAYRFVLFGHLARYLKDNDYPLDTPMPDLMQHAFLGNQPLPDQRILNSVIVGDYENFIRSSFEEEKVTTEYCDKVLLLREHIEFLKNIYLKCYGIKNLGEWKDIDYIEVARFIIDEDILGDSLEPVKLEDEDGIDGCHKYLQAIYKNNSYINQEILSLSRMILGKKQKSRSDKIRKSKEKNKNKSK